MKTDKRGQLCITGDKIESYYICNRENIHIYHALRVSSRSIQKEKESLK